MTIPNLATPAPSGPLIGLLSDTSFTQLVNAALRNYQSTLALSRSELANSALVTPTLVKDEASPTAEERGHGLRLVLQWAVNQLAPSAPAYPLGHYRPLDDATWRDPRWWRYNILRHRYLEPLHPDDFVADGRYTESLLALTGISSTDAFFDERTRAIRAVADHLRQQLIGGEANGELQRLALHKALSPLKTQSEAEKLLGIAATFDDVFPRSLLVEMISQEQIKNLALSLEYLVAQRFLLPGDQGSSLWLSPVLRSYIYNQQTKEARLRRHRQVATYYEEQGEALLAAKHWQRAQQDERAVRVILPAAQELIHELQVKDLVDLLQQVDERHLITGQWYAVQILLNDLFQRNGQHEEALTACRQALKATEEPDEQACIYRRMGKLYEKRNQLQALGYYGQAAKLFEPNHPELPFMLKDRGWLHILRQNWSEAEADLMRASSLMRPENVELSADIADALASLYRRQQRYDLALQEAQRALILREQLGDLFQIAGSFNNLGIIYRSLEEYWQAISAYNEALATYRKLGNQDAIARALINIGSAYFLLEQHQEAITNYQRSLDISRQVNLPHTEATAHYNLAEANATIDQQQAAITHWQQGYDLSVRSGFADEINAFERLQAEMPILQRSGTEVAAKTSTQSWVSNFDLSQEEQTLLRLAETHHQLTARTIVEEMSVSRATATRWLTSLSERGYLTKQGEGRGTYYTVMQYPQDADRGVTATRQTDLQDLAQRLMQLRPSLKDQYGVETVEELPDSRPTLVMTVRFTEPPDLITFFQLEEYLSTELEMRVDLKPQLQ